MRDLSDSDPIIERKLTPLAKPRVRVDFVDSPALIFDMIAALEQGTGPLAVDAERASGFRYSQSAYLIQLHRTGCPVFLIDPQAALIAGDSELGSPANSALANFMATQTWILHASTQDLPCLQELGLKPRSLIDTELGSRLAGIPRVGLGSVVEHYLGLSLAKEHSAVDWSTRPLPASWLDYAALDVEVLPALAEALLADLSQQGKLEIANQEFEHLLGFKPKEKKSERWRGTSGAQSIKSQRGLAVVRELWEARESLAQKLDVSPGRLIPDSSIIFAASEPIRTKSELAGAKSFNGRASRTYLDTWWQAIQTGQTTHDLPSLKQPTSGIPNHRSWPTRFPDADKRLKAARPVVQKIADDLNLPVENLLTPDFLRQLCWIFTDATIDVSGHLQQLGARNWQVELVASPLSSVLIEAVTADERAEHADRSPED